MFGTLRLIFAVFVVYTHLGKGGIIGNLAVFGFYLLSGYLMTLVLNERYYFKAIPYFTNRALRLLPDYWLVAGITLIVIVTIPNVQEFHAAFAISTRPVDFLGNLLIFPFVFYKDGLRLVPPTWSVAIEIVFYFLLWLIIARRKAYALLGLGIGIGFHAWSLLQGRPDGERYYTVIASLLPFALGSLLYFFRPIVLRLTTSKLIGLGVIGAGLFAGSVAVIYEPRVNVPTGGLAIYVNILGVTAIVASLSRFKAPRFDMMLADLAYPVFLLQWLCGFLVSHFFHLERGLVLFWVTLPVILVTAYVISRATRLTIEPLRAFVRSLAQRVSPKPIAEAEVRSPL